MQHLEDQIAQLQSDLADLTGRIAEGERRIANSMVHGPVTDVDAGKQQARIRLGGTDDEPWKSPWLPYAVDAGAFKSVVHPSVGQNMTVLAPAGEHRQGLLIPFAFSADNPSPSSDANKHVLLDFNGAQIYVDQDNLVLKKGNTVVTLTGDKVTVKSDTIVTDGFTKIGGDDASNEVSMRGTIDTAGDRDVGAMATRALVK